MAVHLLIVDALNLIRRIHAVQGSPCVDTCLHALEQLIVHSQPTHAVAVFDDEDRAHGWRHQRLPEYKAGRAPMPETLVAEMPEPPDVTVIRPSSVLIATLPLALCTMRSI